MIGRTEAVEAALSALRQYGDSGDSSFECIGLLTDDKGIKGLKTYRLYQRASFLKAVTLGEPEAVLCERKQSFLSHPLVRIFDLSEFEGRSGEKAKRIVFSVRRDVPSDESYEAVRLFFEDGAYEYAEIVMSIAQLTEKTFSPGKSPVVQIGAQYDESGKAVQLKVYYSLNRCSDYRDLYGKPSSYDGIRQYLREIAQLLRIDGNVVDLFEDKAREICEYSYHPTIIGINFDKESTELKLYHLFSGDTADYRRLCSDAFPFSQFSDDFRSIGDELYEAGLFLKGIAQSCTLAGFQAQVYNGLRLYYFKTPRQLKNS